MLENRNKRKEERRSLFSSLYSLRSSDRSKYFVAFVLLLIIEIFIAIYHFHPIIRGFVGDILVIPLLFCFLRIFFSIACASAKASGGTRTERLVLYILLFAFSVEITQFYHLADALQIESKIIRTIMGSTFEFTDLLAYLIGGLLIIASGKNFRQKKKNPPSPTD